MSGDDPDRFTSDPTELALIAVAWKEPVATAFVRGFVGVSHTRARKALTALEDRGLIARDHDARVTGGQFGWVLTDAGLEATDAWYAAHPGAARVDPRREPRGEA